MKKVLAIALAVICAFGAMAQNAQRTVHGYVIDKNGNPLAGAEVIAAGGGESAITDADGSFTLQVSPFLKALIAKYAGMEAKKMKINGQGDMVFNMKEKWPTRAFINVLGTYSYFEESAGGGGIMAGALGKWGGYGKFTMNSATEITVIGGVIKGINKNVYLFLGTGLGTLRWYDWGGYAVHDYGMAFELGGIFMLSKHFNLTVGCTPILDFEDTSLGVQFNVGCGYVF